MPTDRAELAGNLVGQPIGDWIAERRAAGASWRQIARDLNAATGGRIRATHETVRNWSRPATSKDAA